MTLSVSTGKGELKSELPHKAGTRSTIAHELSDAHHLIPSSAQAASRQSFLVIKAKAALGGAHATKSTTEDGAAEIYEPCA